MVEQTASGRPFTGYFIVLEGIDGSGSTTHTKLLARALRARGLSVVETCEPSPGPIGSMIRQVLSRRLFVADASGPRDFAWSTMALLFAADRMDHLDQVVLPALREGSVVLSDRYDLSSLAYQSVTAATGAQVVPWIREINAGAYRPDLTIVLDVALEVAEARRRSRGGVEEVFEVREIQARLCGVYREAEALVPNDRLVHVAGEGEVAAVAERILSAVLRTNAAIFSQ